MPGSRFALARVAVAMSAVAALLVGCGSSMAPGGTILGSEKLTVVVVVVDSLEPEDFGPNTPNLLQLRDEGTFFPESRAVFSAETIPNHVAMMTGVYPERNGVPTNNYIDFDAPGGAERRDLSHPEEVTANTLFTWITRQCRDSGINSDIRHGAALSKKYLYEIFLGDDFNPERANRNPSVRNVVPDRYWDPQSDPAYIGPQSEHTPDLPTMSEALQILPEVDFLFVNLGDVDRASHASARIGRNAALPVTDAQIGRLVDALKSAGRWETSVLIVVSDHGMDYSWLDPDAVPSFEFPPLNQDALAPPNAITTQTALDGLSACFAPMTAVQNGGTNSIYVTDRDLPAADRQTAVRAARACLLGLAPCSELCAGVSRPANADGIAYAWYTHSDTLDPDGNMPGSVRSAHPNLGDLVLIADGGFRFSDPSAQSNPIPGNHGHGVTLRSTMLVTGGSAWVRRGVVVEPSVTNPGLFERLPEQGDNVDVAPTVAWLLGLGMRDRDFPDHAVHGRGFDGRILREAFVQFEAGVDAPPPSVCGRFD
jgi:hypothetical protein